jgi:hypothetical protein
LIGRSGINFAEFIDLGKNDLAKNNLDKNGPTQKILEDSKEYGKPSEKTVSHIASGSQPARKSQVGFEKDKTNSHALRALGHAHEREEIKFEEIILPDWKIGTHRFPDLPKEALYGEAMVLDQFFAWANAFGGLPPHLRSIAAYRQMDECDHADSKPLGTRSAPRL